MDYKFQIVFNDKKVCNSKMVYRIKALRSFGVVKKGDLGGYVEKPENLSQEGNCWIFGNACVMGKSKVADDAVVSENALVCDYAKVKDSAFVGGNAAVFQNASVGERAVVVENAEVYGKAKVKGNALIKVRSRVCGSAKVSGMTVICDDALVSGNAVVESETLDWLTIDGNTVINGDAEVRKRGDYVTFKDWQESPNYVTWTKSNNKWCCEWSNSDIDELIKKAYGVSEENGQFYETLKCTAESLIGPPEKDKYCLTDETKDWAGIGTLYRIKALRNFSDVKKGDLGGFVHSENNLSQSGDCWVYDDAMVAEDSSVFGSAKVSGKAKVYGSAFVSGNCEVKDAAKVSNNAVVSDSACVSGDSIVKGSAHILDYASVSGKCIVMGNSVVRDRAVVRGNAIVSGRAHIGGDAVVNNSSDYTVANIWWKLPPVIGDLEMPDVNYITWTKSDGMWSVGNNRLTTKELRAHVNEDSSNKERFELLFSLIKGHETLDDEYYESLKNLYDKIANLELTNG